MAIKNTLICDKCKKNNNETVSVGKISLWRGTYLDYDRYKDDYKQVDLCSYCMESILKSLIKKLSKEEQQELCSEIAGLVV